MKNDTTNFLTAIVGFVILVLIAAIGVMLLWNAVIPELFHISEIDFGQSLCLVLLVDFLLMTAVSSKKE